MSQEQVKAMALEDQSKVQETISESAFDKSNSSSNSSANSVRIGMDGSFTAHVADSSTATDALVLPPTSDAKSVILFDESELPPDEENCRNSVEEERSCCRKHKIGISILATSLLLVAGGIVVWLFYMPSEETPILLLEDYDSSHTAAVVSDNICYEWIPGEGKSGVCAAEDTKQSGGELCNIVAKSLLHVVGNADIAIVNAGICRGDVLSGELTVGAIYDAIHMEDLVVVEMPGSAIRQVLEDALEFTFENNDGTAYPYAAGARYNVEGNVEYNNRVSGLEIYFDKAPIWVRINSNKFYKVVTTGSLVDGQLGYREFTNVIDAWTTSLSFETGDAFFDYASKNASWSVLEEDEYSTQSFVSASKIADVPHYISLENGGACNLVAWGILDQVLKADIAVLNAGVCGSNVRAGSFLLEDAQALIPKNPPLVTFNLQASQVLDALENAVDASLEGRSHSYPYSAGLRFDVNGHASKGSRLSNVEILDRSNRWTAMVDSMTLTVLTTSDLSAGRNNDFSAFSQGHSAAPTSPSSAIDMFVAYATEWGSLYNPPEEKMSTQTYVA